MKTYQVTMDDRRVERISANSAGDAIQSALMKNPGHTVKACSMRDLSGNGMDFGVPIHKALTVEDVERLTPKREIREKKQRDPRDVPAPWIQEWLDKKSRA